MAERILQIDIFASTRIFNYKKINWNTNKALLFKTMCQIRNQDVKTVGIQLTAVLQRMNEKLDAIVDFELNQFTGRYMLHMLARLTDYVDTRMGHASQFETYIDRSPKSSYDIEHILPDDYPSYAALFNDEEDFKNYRRKFGKLRIPNQPYNFIKMIRARMRKASGLFSCTRGTGYTRGASKEVVIHMAVSDD